MSDERTPSRRDAQIAEVASEIASEAVGPGHLGALRLAEAALHSPAPPSEAEAEARGRALMAFEQAQLAPRMLHAEPWGAAPLPLVERLARLVRRLWRR